VGDFRTGLTTALIRALRLPSVVRRRARRSAGLGAVLLAASAVTAWAAANTPPTITSVSASPAVVNEGQTVTVSGTFTDPDAGDAHTVRVYWGDGSAPDKVQLPPGQFSFQVNHTFRDEVPGTTMFLVVADHQLPLGSNDNADGQGEVGVQVPLVIKNVAPKFAPGIQVTKVGKVPGKVAIDGDFTDPGADRFKVLANFGDGLPNHQFPPLPNGVSECAVTGHHFHCEHQYAVQQPGLPKTFQIRLGVQDGDGGQDTFNTSVQIP
jgi:hypothetical protein